jgi:hypothetical protein
MVAAEDGRSPVRERYDAPMSGQIGELAKSGAAAPSD